MKETSKDGRVWFEKKGTEIQMGFTPQMLGELDDCWHLLPAASNKQEIRENQPLLSVETNDGLFSVPTPVSGIITFFDNKAMNFPQKLTTDDVVCVVKDAEEVRRQKAAADEELRRALEAHAAQIEQRQLAELQRVEQPARPVMGAWGQLEAMPVQRGNAEAVNRLNVGAFNDFFDQQARNVRPEAPQQAPRPANPRRNRG